MSPYRAPAYLNKNVCAYAKDSGQEPRLQAAANKTQKTKSVNVKMPKLIAMAVPWIRAQEEAKEPEARPCCHLQESKLELESKAQSKSDLAISHSPLFGRHKRRMVRGGV